MTEETIDIASRAERRRSMAEENKDLHEENKELRARLQHANQTLSQIAVERDRVLAERGHLLAALTKFLPGGIAIDANAQQTSPQWRHFVGVDMPTGQGFWHFHEAQLKLFRHLKPYSAPFDGHDYATKYRRLDEIRPKGSIITL